MPGMERPPRRYRRSEARPLIRRDAEGAKRTAPDWESLVERLIREAQEAGQFDDLPGRGGRLALLDDSAAGELAMGYHVLRNAGMAPPWIEADKEIRAHRQAIERLLAVAARTPASGRDRLLRRLNELADQHDRAVARLESLAPSSRQHRGRVDRTLLRDRLEAALTGS
jgi:hypothetical protein